MQGKNLEHRQGQPRPAGLGPGHTCAPDLQLLPSGRGCKLWSPEPSWPLPSSPPAPSPRSANVSPKHSLCSQPLHVRFITVNPFGSFWATKQDPFAGRGFRCACRLQPLGQPCEASSCSCALDGRLLGTSCCGAPSLIWRPALCKELGTPGSGHTACPVALRPQGQHSGAGSPRVGHPAHQARRGPRVQADKPLPYQQNLYPSLII